MKQTGRIILASASPRRKAFFDLLGFQVEVIPSEIAEVGYGGDPALVPLRMTQQKIKAVKARLGSSFEGWIVGADTVVALDHDMFGKPKDQEDGRCMLRKLSGKIHQVYTGFRVESELGKFREGTLRTEVEMAQLSEEEINWYLSSGEPQDKAGAYAIQGKGGLFVRSIQGSYSNVVGLPFHEVIQALKTLGAISDR